MEQTIQKHFLYPAGLYASTKPTEVTTILGSCVAVCLYDPVHQLGGINHFMLPRWDGTGLPSAKFGDYAIRRLLERMLSIGAEKKYLQAKLFGGICSRGELDVFSIGAHNIQLAESHLAQLNIPVMVRQVGGRNPYKLVFNTQSGVVKLHTLLPDLKQKE